MNRPMRWSETPKAEKKIANSSVNQDTDDNIQLVQLTQDQRIRAISEHPASPRQDDEIGISSSVVDGIDTELMIKPLEGPCQYRHDLAERVAETSKEEHVHESISNDERASEADTSER